MEGLARLVSESMARHGVEASIDQRRLQWSRWFRCESSLSFLLTPAEPGVFALGEEIAAPGQISATGGQRMLAVFQISETSDLGLGLGQLFAPGSPLRERLAAGRCFTRYVVIEDDAQRRSTAVALQRWLDSSAETASGMPAGFATRSDSTPATSAVEKHQPGAASLESIQRPAPLPFGF
jgi:hypothetical protein